MATSSDPIRAIADAVLYEGYILWPYRRSAMKNQRRFNFGGVYPPEHAVAHPDDPDRMQTEVLLEADESATLEVTVRFLHIVQRGVEDATGRRVDALTVDAEQYLSWEEAIERELDVPLLRIGGPGTDLDVTIAPGDEREAITDAAGRTAGALTRQWDRLDALVSVSVHPVRQRLWRVAVEIRNRTSFDPAQSRQRALRADAVLDAHPASHRRRRVRLLDRSPGGPRRGGGGLPQRRQLAGARRRAPGPEHDPLLADHPRGLSARRAGESG